MQKTVLLIDDSAFMLRFLTHVFKKDYRVATFNNVNEVDNWLQENNRPDLVVLDYHLEEVTGLDVMNKIRKEHGLPNVPVIMLSGVKNSEMRWQCIEAGANDFLAKPFHPKELLLRANLLSRSRQAATA